MNISQPISSTIDSVDFDFLTPAEIKAISVKRIENPTTFDSLLNPVPGGLYDPALGAWGDSICTTCNLAQPHCPGHVGHIDLPVPVYHPVFMDQVLRLLRAQCQYCFRFRMRRVDLSLVACKLRLLQFGLIDAAKHIDDIALDTADGQMDDEQDSDGADITLAERLILARETYTRDALKEHRLGTADIRKGKHEGASEARREVLKNFLRDMTKGRACATCKAISPSFRKDRFVKIFEKPLSAKDQVKMAQSKFRHKDALVIRRESKTDTAKNPGYDTDEGIADVDLPSSEGEEQESNEDEEGEGEELDENGDVIMSGSGAAAKSSQAKDTAAKSHQRYVNSMEVQARLQLLFEKEQDIMGLVYNSRPLGKKVPADNFFLQTILVPPNKFRPEARQGDGAIAEAQQNSLYKQILAACAHIAQIHKEISQHGKDPNAETRQRDISEMHEACIQLQDAVNSLIDRDRNPIRGAAGKRNEDGIKQKLEKKEGLFRKNMMGKRVNYAARSVISPDPNIETSEIGVPPVFAKKLTYPEPVTSHNFREMQQAVINGVDKWPGASAIENENGQIINLKNKTVEDRVALANQLLAPTSHEHAGMKGKKVHRHLGNGDVVLMNRQPTLHKPSIMGHRARVLPGEKTIRMHYANCNTYNADFDGDEMNMHFPQNELARAEALKIADTDHQYLSATAGKPLRGLIQDHLSVSVALCSKDAFFDKGAYHQLIYSALRPESGHITSERLVLVPPATLKPVKRWTGKQVITTILMNIKPAGCGDLWLTGKSSIPPGAWGSFVEEGNVLISDGEFISGILDKSQLGPSSGGFIHSIHEIWGPESAAKLLSCLGRLLTRFLNMRAFSCGMDDLRLTPEGEQNRKKKLEGAKDIGLKVAAKYVSLGDRSDVTSTDPMLLERLEEVMRDDSKQEDLDHVVNAESSQLSSEVTRACLPVGLEKPFPKNQMQSMTTSGAKGSSVNANLISCNLGQQVLEGRRVPLMVSGKSLPCFRPFESNVRAGGYVVNRFLTGIRPQEYFFHHMAGREGLIDTAVKTSRSGYLQRCLIKGMEGLKVAYDSSVRDADGSMVQFLYGEDGLDITKQKYLNDFSFVLRNQTSQINQLGIADRGWDQEIYESREFAQKYSKKAVKQAKANYLTGLDPIHTELNPNRHAFSTSEKFYEKVSEYIKTNPDGLIKRKDEKTPAHMSKVVTPRKYAEKIFYTKYLSSLVEPGEAVGIVAGQSVGEPSTQMTLNTFHLAGHSAKNVTLGIPRLREILMTASDHISTPSMTLVLNEELSEVEGEIFAKAISILPLSHVLDKVTVKERVGKGIGYREAKMFDVRLEFFPSSEYSKTYAISVSDVLDTLETEFLPRLEKLARKEIKAKTVREGASAPEVGVKAGVVEMASANPGAAARDEDEDEDDDDDDDDATNAKQRANKEQAVSYGANDDEDDEIRRQLEREASPEDEEEPEDEGIGGSPPPSGDDESSDDGEGGKGTGGGRENRVKERTPAVSRFECDESKGEWCDFTLEYDSNIPKILMLSVVQEAVRKTLVQQIAGIRSCTYVSKETVSDLRTGAKENRAVVHTNGVNLQAMQKYGDFIDPNRTQTNDIAAVLRVYGVEAARRNIILELSRVFEGHGISVDNRHLNLIGDYMTRNGGFTPFNRNGLKGNVSPFTKMSFETTLAFLKDAVLDGDWDDLSTPSSRIVVGRLGKIGTGAFDVLTRAHPRNGKQYSS
ncbi:beta and beta-prime subunits of DNA dependent RNA-polymerase [Durotheca rogersii]|uniref:beta and beta-prime subunits of DNA dependent RNA-polymerase n=1 Tax=Durotheca rogersii TaxID=419775 RepID=UPI00221F0E7B|nr:beta and beta-prime subunits of DNA dependent RNA-polymerase [Durotheca rogersii]KAI5864165.1 beta and beta-prime subunits of DNA dependent RNA-polymerase [Durotheca rogersii]